MPFLFTYFQFFSSLSFSAPLKHFICQSSKQCSQALALFRDNTCVKVLSVFRWPTHGQLIAWQAPPETITQAHQDNR